MIQGILSRIEQLLRVRGAPIVVALDGPSGAGKSTMANALAGAAPVVVTIVPSDDFFAAGLTAADWDARSAAERARDAIDWRRLRRTALEPLRAGRPAVWHPFDFAGGEQADGSYLMSTTPVRREAAPVIVVEGAYASRPELADILDLSVLIDAPTAVRHERLAARESPAFLAAWHRRWDAAEAYYFSEVRPAPSFDIAVDTETGTAQYRAGTTSSDDPPAFGSDNRLAGH
ncbi:MAG TPA: AAA family ATPase [Gemmatimonadaceae bacterium]